MNKKNRILTALAAILLAGVTAVGLMARSGEICNGSGKNLWCPAVYSNQNGLLQSACVPIHIR